MTQETYYKKDENGDFVPVSYYDSNVMESLPYGSHLVRVAPGRGATRYHIDPDNAAVIAALEYARDAIVDELVSFSRAKPSQKPVTAMQKEAWDNMKEAFGNDMVALQYSSPHEVADGVIGELQFIIDEMMTNECVKKAYDEFVLVSKLCGQKKQKEYAK